MNPAELLAAMGSDIPPAFLARVKKGVKVVLIYTDRWYWRTEFDHGQFVLFVADENASREALSVALDGTTQSLNCNVAASQMAAGNQAELDQQRQQ